MENRSYLFNIHPNQWQSANTSVLAEYGGFGYPPSFSWQSQLPAEVSATVDPFLPPRPPLQQLHFDPYPRNNVQLTNFRPQTTSEDYGVSFPLQRQHLQPPKHTTLFSNQKWINLKQNPKALVKVKERQRQRRKEQIAYLTIGDHYHGGCNHPDCTQLFRRPNSGPSPLTVAINAELRRQSRDAAQREQINNSIPFQKAKALRRKANVFNAKKVKRLQGRDFPFKGNRYRLWKTEKEPKDELRSLRKINRNRRRDNSSPDECPLWNCQRKKLRKGRLDRRYPRAPESTTSENSFRSRSPILGLRDSPPLVSPVGQD